MNQSILVVDDELSMLKLLERIISDETSYHVETTNTSLEVPEILKEREFDLIISDLKMPGMDGMDILRLVKEQNRKEEVVIITAFGELNSALEALHIGVFDYLSKPFKKELILNTITRAMRRQRAHKSVKHLSTILEKEPYEKACTLFKEEYIKRLTDRYNNDENIMAEKSALTVESIKPFLDDK